MRINFNKLNTEVVDLTICGDTFCKDESTVEVPSEIELSFKINSNNVDFEKLDKLWVKLYNRNERVKKIVQLNAPSMIVDNEKRMLQEAVEELLSFIIQTKVKGDN